jgi:chromosomal replication initiation ATPase DnaA
MTEADRIAEFANVNHELAELVVIGATRGGSSVKALRGPSQTRDLVELRRWIIARARARVDFDGRPLFSFPAIGRALNRDHTTIMHHDRHLKSQGRNPS